MTDLAAVLNRDRELYESEREAIVALIEINCQIAVTLAERFEKAPNEPSDDIHHLRDLIVKFDKYHNE